MLCVFFFFKQKTAYEMRISDWSSDVCSSDLCISLISIGYSCGVFVLMYIESIATGNGIPHGRDLWSKADVQRRRHDYTTMANWDQALLSSTSIDRKSVV